MAAVMGDRPDRVEAGSVGPQPAEDGEPGTLETRPVYDGRVVHLAVDSVRFPDGTTGELEMIRHPGASAVLPLVGGMEESDPEILLLRQYRYATGGYLYEVPAGLPLGPDEPWEECARRELEEETGMRAGTLVPLTRIYTTPGFTDEVIHLFLAYDLREGEGNLDDDEFVEVVRVRLSRAMEWVGTGEIQDGKSICTLLFAARFVLHGTAKAGIAPGTGP